MNILEFTLAVGVVSLLAGFLGALSGLGGGSVLVPVLTLLFGVDLRYAIGASLVSVIATSSGAAAAYVREGYTNIRVGMFLEVATTSGAILGAYLGSKLPTHVIGIIFGIVLLYSAYLSFQPHLDHLEGLGPDPLAVRLRLDGDFPTPEGDQKYHVQHVPEGFGLMLLAGVLSSLLGIGSGAVKVLAMDQMMRLPFKVSTTTSNFMIGVTAAAGAGAYLKEGYIHPGLSMPVMLGVLIGSLLGARVLIHLKVKWLRLVFGLLVGVLAAEMIINSITGRI